MPKSKLLTVVGGKIALFNKNNEILFLVRSDKMDRPGGWDLPGGAVEIAEDPIEAIKRETREESGLSATNVIPIHVGSETTTEKFVVMVGYSGQVEKEAEPVLSFEHTTYKWMTPKEALNTPLPLFHATVIKKALQFDNEN